MKIIQLEERLNVYQSKIDHLELQQVEKDQQLSHASLVNKKLMSRLQSLKAFMESLERRNNELEYAYFKTNKRHWGSQGLGLEFASELWKDGF